MVCRLVECENLGLPPQRRRHLGALAFAVAQSLPAVRPVALETEDRGEASRVRIGVGEEFPQVVGRCVGALRAEERRGVARYAAGDRGDLTGGERQERALPDAVGTDDTGPPRGYVYREIIDEWC